MKGEFPQSFILSLLIRDSIIALHFCNLLLQFLHLLLLQHFFVFDRDYLDELVGIAWPVIEHGACQFGTGGTSVRSVTSASASFRSGMPLPS